MVHAETPVDTKPTKLSRLPKTQRIQKRPLLHPAIAAPRKVTSSTKIVYVSASTPFVATIKRVQKFLGYIEERSIPKLKGAYHEKHILQAIEQAAKARDEKKREEVIIKGTGKAVESVLRLGLWWQGRSDVIVRVGTGSVGAVDDVLEDGAVEASRVRRVSCLEVGVRMK